jgi:PAS domain S-box-containing protein
MTTDAKGSPPDPSDPADPLQQMRRLQERNAELERQVQALERAEQARLKSERFTEDVFESIQDGISVLDPDLTIRHVNSKMKQWYAENLPLEGRKCFRCYHNADEPCDPCPTVRALSSGRPEFDVVPGLEGSEVEWVELFSYPIKDRETGQTTGVVEFVRDITEKRRLEQQLQQAQRLEAVGTLAGGVAHDFNNLLMGIQGRASLMLASAEEDHPFRDQLLGIEEHVASASELTRQLLGFARAGKYQVRPLDLNQVVQRCAGMFGRTRKEIKLHFDLADGLPAVEMDGGQIEQVLLNLLLNAWQAMKGGGSVHLATGLVRLDGDEPWSQGLPAGSYIRLSVTDTGPGIPADVQPRIFDPFFTTRGSGRGAGLGLASAYGIVHNHNGAITVHSDPGQGASFLIHLPVSDRPAGPRRTGRARAPVTGRASGTVLLVDDEAFVLDIGRRMLERLGFTVLCANTGEQALRIYREQRDRIDLVVLDMIMPQMSGGEVFDRLKELDPEVQVMLSSGYSIDGEAAQILARGVLGFLQKPFKLQQLREKLQELLDRD